MKTAVGRIYRFRAVHSLPGFPEPWCFPHQHDYTVEVMSEGGTDTAKLDAWWQTDGCRDNENMNRRFVPSTVEEIATSLLEGLPPEVLSVVVREDKQRWGLAERCWGPAER